MKVEVPSTYLRKHLFRDDKEKSGGVAPYILNDRN